MDHAQPSAPDSHDPRDDGRHLLTVMAGVMVVLVAIAVVLAGDWWNDPQDPPRPGGSRIDTRTLAWDPQDHGTGFTVATSWREYVATRADSDNMAAAMREAPTDFSRNVVVTASISTRCETATAIRLYADGDHLALDVDLPGDGPKHCTRAYYAAADFEVPRELLPTAPLMDGRGPQAAGVGILRSTALVTAQPGLGVLAAEVPDEETARGWLASLGGVPGEQGITAPMDLAAAYRNPDAATFDLSRERTFAFLYPVCDSNAAQLRQGPDGRLDVAKAEAPSPDADPKPDATPSCAPEAYRLAVFSLAPEEVPANPPALYIWVRG